MPRFFSSPSRKKRGTKRSNKRSNKRSHKRRHTKKQRGGRGHGGDFAEVGRVGDTTSATAQLNQTNPAPIQSSSPSILTNIRSLFK